MAIDLDLSGPLRRPSDLHRLIEAIVGAKPEDESDWLEWKSTLDLTTAHGRAHVARAVLGMANRMPDRAARHAGGLGYVVIGVKPGEVTGVDLLDPADLENGLDPYLGSQGPTWSPHHVSFQGSDVLVVIVEAPQWGDPIYVLQKETPRGHRSGTIFVRRPGKTAIADAAEVGALQRRLIRSVSRKLDLVVGVAGDVPLPWIQLEGYEEIVADWAADERRALIERARRVEARRNAPDPLNPLLSAAMRQVRELNEMSSLGHLGGPTPDKRSIEEYERQLDEWVAHVLEDAEEALLASVFDDDRAVIQLTVSNPTDFNLSDVQIKAHILGEAVTGDLEPFDDLPWPSQPRAFGEPTPALSIPAYNFSLPSMPVIGNSGPARMWIEDGSVRVRWDVGDLRPREETDSYDIFMFLCEYPPDGALRAKWTATTTSDDGVIEGEFEVPVRAEPVTVSDLLPYRSK